jgi:hypothetical protein
MSQDWDGLKLPPKLLDLLKNCGYSETEQLHGIRILALDYLKRGRVDEAWSLMYGGRNPMAPSGSYRKVARDWIAVLDRSNTIMELGPILYSAGTWYKADRLAQYIGDLQDALKFTKEFDFLTERMVIYEAWEAGQQESMRRWRERNM